MTNKELITIFEKAEMGSENIFDIYDYLSLYEKDYQEFSLIKICPTIYDAYELYSKHQNKMIDAIKYFLNEADFSSIVNLFDFTDLLNQIPEEYSGVIKQLMEEVIEKN